VVRPQAVCKAAGRGVGVGGGEGGGMGWDVARPEAESAKFKNIPP